MRMFLLSYRIISYNILTGILLIASFKIKIRREEFH